MTEDGGDIQWLEGKGGDRLGVQTVVRNGEQFVRVIFPDGRDRLISQKDAAAVVAMLMTGVSFTDITGADGFTASPEDF
ncbi:hypothetical protein HCA61_03720 [Rhodococcus sp. HNM0563]|uniref:hypothetical protein n=1 Tax=Rhodococcus sp. HNM0563 TaxID=2716339 RepID=UPI00146B6640|nr:hypothetical protein [Rhodococcus sp. HNM0563]NLU61370.1 hypothetical protein [Rhodococcus sp. HNM0563]